jgi:hypothetical protein
LREIDLKEGIWEHLKGIAMEEKFLHYDVSNYISKSGTEFDFSSPVTT